MKKWTQEEIDYLASNPQLKPCEMALFLNRTETSVRRKLEALGLKYKRVEWTEEEIKILRETTDRSTEEVSKILGRPLSSVLRKCTELQIKRDKSWTEVEKLYVLKNYKKMTYAEIGKKLNKTEATIRGFVQRNNLTKIEVWTDEDIEYLKENFSKIPAGIIALKLKKPRKSVWNKATEMNLTSVFLEKITIGAIVRCMQLKRRYHDPYKKLISLGLPYKRIKYKTQNHYMVNIEKFWKWLEKNRDEFNFCTFERYSLGVEPAWVNVKRVADWDKANKKRWGLT